MIYCGDDWCIYWDKWGCRLDSITINSNGNCTDCIHVSISSERLKELREEQLYSLEEEEQ